MNDREIIKNRIIEHQRNIDAAYVKAHLAINNMWDRLEKNPENEVVFLEYSTGPAIVVIPWGYDKVDDGMMKDGDQWYDGSTDSYKLFDSTGLHTYHVKEYKLVIRKKNLMRQKAMVISTHVDIEEGWAQILTGNTEPGDKRYVPAKGAWIDVSGSDIGAPALSWSALIRKKK
jgi:hypothetical protein